jgi:hypothetical protein
VILNEHPDSNHYPGVRAIGFWRDKCGPQVEELRQGMLKGHQGYVLDSMPDPKDYIDGLWDASLRGDRAMVVSYLKAGRSVEAAMAPTRYSR